MSGRNTNRYAALAATPKGPEPGRSTSSPRPATPPGPTKRPLGNTPTGCTPAPKRFREDDPQRPEVPPEAAPAGACQRNQAKHALLRAKETQTHDEAMQAIAVALDNAISSLYGPARRQAKKMAYKTLRMLREPTPLHPTPPTPPLAIPPRSGQPAKPKGPAQPKGEKKDLGSPKKHHTNKDKEDKRLLVRLNPDRKSKWFKDDLSDFGFYRHKMTLDQRLLVQRISKTKTGLALHPFPGAKAAKALRTEMEAIQSSFREKMKDNTLVVEPAHSWYTYTVNVPTDVDPGKLGAEIRASAGIPWAQGLMRDITGVDDERRLVLHFLKRPPPFHVLGRWARPNPPRPGPNRAKKHADRALREPLNPMRALAGPSPRPGQD